jgi:hypothetical protein
VALSGHHAAEILSLPSLLFGARASSSAVDDRTVVDSRLLDRAFARIHSPDEVYLPLCLGLLGHLAEVQKALPNGGNSGSSGSVTAGRSQTCSSGVLRKSMTYVQWPDDWKDSVHPVSFEALTPALLQRVRVHNHPRVNKRLTRDYSAVTIEDGSLTIQLDDFVHSALFLRKVKTGSSAAQTELTEQWKSLVLGHALCLQTEPDSESGTVTVDVDNRSNIAGRKRKGSDSETDCCVEGSSSSKRQSVQDTK